MNDQKLSALKKLSIRVDALRRAMDAVMNGAAPNLAKWSAYKSYARTYNTFAQTYVDITGDGTVTRYAVEKLPNCGDTVWPIQKQYFDTTYADTLILSSILSEFEIMEPPHLSLRLKIC